jgi:hypothetical protein
MIGEDILTRVLRTELEGAIQRYVENDQESSREALQLFDGLLPVQSDDTKDASVSEDVADMIEAVTAQMLPSFEDVGAVQFEAINGDDEAAARLESEVIRSMLIEGRNADAGFVALQEAIKDAALQRLAVVSIDIETTHERVRETWDQLSAVDAAEMIEPRGPNEEVVVIATPELDEETQLYTMTIERVITSRALVMRSVARENFVTSSLEERDQNRARFCAHRTVCDRASLVSRGFDEDTIKALPMHQETNYDAWISRNRSQPTDNAQQFASESVEVWRCFALVAEGKDSARAERYEIWYSRDADLILAEPRRCGMVGYGLGVLILYPHRLEGMSLADKLRGVQVSKTKIQRMWMDNFAKVNRPRIAVDESTTNMADAMDATGDVIRTQGPPQAAIWPTADLGPSASAALAYFDKVRTERGGASLEMQGAAMQVTANQTAQGIERQYSTKEMLAATMARTFAETLLRQVFVIAHYELRTRWGAPIDAKIGGEWQQVDPSQWRARKRVSVRVGQSVSERGRTAAALSGVVQLQSTIMQSPLAGQLTDASRIFNALSDLVVASQLRSPDRYFLDPASQQAQQAQQAAAQQQQQQQQAGMAMQRALMLLEKYKIDSGSAENALTQIVNLAKAEAELTMSTQALDEAQMIAGAEAGQAAAGKAQAEAQAQPGQMNGAGA